MKFVELSVPQLGRSDVVMLDEKNEVIYRKVWINPNGILEIDPEQQEPKFNSSTGNPNTPITKILVIRGMDVIIYMSVLGKPSGVRKIIENALNNKE